ncbi:MAG: peptidoglycan DD-metalloendopeptidase family protein [Gemmatimonadales bacterium]
MSKHYKRLTIMIHKEGDLNSRSFTLPVWLFRAAATVSLVLAGVIVLAAVLYAPVLKTAARVPDLTKEVARLSAENQQVRELASNLDYVEARYGQIRTMLGVDIVPELSSGDDSLPTARPLVARTPAAMRCHEPGASLPTHWPLDHTGVITRGQVGAGSSSEVHAGVDIAVAKGTPVRAAGGGVVRRAGKDPEYGLFIELSHPGGYTSMYGHASRLLVTEGDAVATGQVVALSGSTGHSTAPHLHFEVRHNGVSVDPSSNARRECNDGDFLLGGDSGSE